MTQFDLRRDIAWLLGALPTLPSGPEETGQAGENSIDETVEHEVYGDFRSLIDADSEHVTFDSYDEFAKHCQSVMGKDFGYALLDRVQDFFATVREVSSPSGHVDDFVYRYEGQGADGTAVSALLYADWRQGESFFKVVTEGGDPSLDEYLHVFREMPSDAELETHVRIYNEDEEVRIEEMAQTHSVDAENIKSVLDELLVSYPRDDAFDLLQNFEGRPADLSKVLKAFGDVATLEIVNEYPERVSEALRWRGVVGADIALNMLRTDMFRFLDGLHRADQEAIVKRCFTASGAEFRAGCQQKFSAYTRGEKYPYHRDYAEKVSMAFGYRVTTPEILGFLLTESNGDRTAVSPGGYTHGLMQMSRSVFGSYHVSASDRPNDIYNYKSNIYAGVHYLDAVGLKNDNNPNHSMGIAIGNYNRGEGTMNKNYLESPSARLPEITSEYVSSVFLYSLWFGELLAG